MADRTTDLIIVTRPSSGRDAFPIENAVTLAAGTLLQLQNGRANHWDDSGSNDIFLGIAISGDDGGSTDGSWLGDTSGDPDPDPEVGVDTSGATLMHLASVAGPEGVAPIQTDVGRVVYCPDSDTDNITTVSTTNTNVIGFIIRFRSATDVDVRLFSPSEWLAYNYESPGS